MICFVHLCTFLSFPWAVTRILKNILHAIEAKPEQGELEKGVFWAFIISHLHYGVILLQLPECFTNFLSYSDFYSLLRIVEQLALITLQKKVGKAFW